MKIRETVQKYADDRKKYTYSDYAEMPDDGNRYEIIDGELILVPVPTTIHQMVSGNIDYELRTFVKASSMGRVFDAPLDVKIDDVNVVQPDILFISNERKNIITEKNIAGAPDLAIEIVSPSSAYQDLVNKKELYAVFGVREYWIVDPKKERVEIYVNKAGKFELNQQMEREGILKSVVLSGFELEMKKIFAA